MTYICTPCPLESAREVAKQLAERPDHQSSLKHLGGIALNQMAHEALTAQIDCPGASVNSNGHLVCPLESYSFMARNMGAGSWNQSDYALPLDQLTENKTADNNRSVTGQYL